MQQRGREQHLLPHAFRIRRNGHVPVAMQREQAQQAVDALGGRFGRQAAQLPHHDQVFEAAEVRVKMRLLGHVAHALLVGDQVALDGLRRRTGSRRRSSRSAR